MLDRARPQGKGRCPLQCPERNLSAMPLPSPLPPPPGGANLRIFSPVPDRKALPAPRPSLPPGTGRGRIVVAETTSPMTIWTDAAWEALPASRRPRDACLFEGGFWVSLTSYPTS